MNTEQIYLLLKLAFKGEATKYDLLNEKLKIEVKQLSADEAIGNPTDQDYPVIKGKEKMIQAVFREYKGQAFTDEYGDSVLTINELLEMPLETNRDRANFIAGLNAVWRYLDLCDKTVHCKDEELHQCADSLLEKFDPSHKVLLVGLQPRFLEVLAKRSQQVRVIDLDVDNVGKKKFGVEIEGADQTADAMEWCDAILATGSTIVNGTLPIFLDTGKPTLFYGVTIAAAASILNLNTFCLRGH